MTNDNGRAENKSHRPWHNKNNRDGDNKKNGRNFPKKNKQGQPIAAPPRPPHQKWTPSPGPTTPIPTLICPHCQKTIRELAQAFTDKTTGQAIHFDCARQRIADAELLEEGETVAYIGAGRFGILQFAALSVAPPRPGKPNNGGHGAVPRDFKIRKIIEWEKKEEKPDWRGAIADHFSLT